VRLFKLESHYPSLWKFHWNGAMEKRESGRIKQEVS